MSSYEVGLTILIAMQIAFDAVVVWALVVKTKPKIEAQNGIIRLLATIQARSVRAVKVDEKQSGGNGPMLGTN